MHKEHLPAPIRLLPPQLADQIAAGEVIERPASVLKELIENALDAACTRIDIELHKGGMELIRVSDDGHGIPAEEMLLAISRHATSKISSLDDLLHLHSLGFRGEALASICSVSQWELQSCAADQQQASSLTYTAPAQVQLAHHAPGTSVTIQQLFFNTPARRKFLRTERTELRYCDDVIRRMALARFDVGFYVRHNARFIHRLPAVRDDMGRTRRVSKLCGTAFTDHALAIDYSHRELRLWGWISNADYSRQQTDLQFFYINGRIIRDRVINHAIRSAYQAVLPAGRHAAYVLYLELDPTVVDVNVHPTKHEVRFRESRSIHDFISHNLRDALQTPVLHTRQGSHAFEVAEAVNAYAIPLEREAGKAGARRSASTFGSVIAVVLQRYVLAENTGQLYLIDARRLHAQLRFRDWQEAVLSGQIKSQPVLIPQTLRLSTVQHAQYEANAEQLSRLGFELTASGPDSLLLRAIPVYLRGFDASALVLALLSGEFLLSTLPEALREWMLQQALDIELPDCQSLLTALADDTTAFSDCWRELTHADLHNWLQQAGTRHDGQFA